MAAEPVRLDGFTVEIDGNPEVVERIFRAMSNEIQAVIEECHRKQAEEHFFMDIKFPPRFMLPLYPFKGTITLRTQKHA